MLEEHGWKRRTNTAHTFKPLVRRRHCQVIHIYVDLASRHNVSRMRQIFTPRSQVSAPRAVIQFYPHKVRAQQDDCLLIDLVHPHILYPPRTFAGSMQCLYYTQAC